jgi:hypothetical protein
LVIGSGGPRLEGLLSCRDGGCLRGGLGLLLRPLLWSLRRLDAGHHQREKNGRGYRARPMPDSKSFAATHNHGNPPSRDCPE